MIKRFTDKLSTPLTGAIFGGCCELLFLLLFCSAKLLRDRQSCCVVIPLASLAWLLARKLRKKQFKQHEIKRIKVSTHFCATAAYTSDWLGIGGGDVVSLELSSDAKEQCSESYILQNFPLKHSKQGFFPNL